MLNTRTAVRIAAAALLLLTTAPSSTACLWVNGTSYQGHSKRVEGPEVDRELRTALQHNHHEEGLKMQSALVNSTNFNDRSDYAVSLAYVGRTKEAVDLLQALENEQPGQYFIAANLGTCLELLGNNEEALRWIREGIRRNPQSHEGTEWLHAKILEAKIAAQLDPDYFKKHSVLELDPSRVSSPMTIDSRLLKPSEVAKAIHYQLEERLQFVKPPDPAIASLLFDYAAIEAATNILESAKGLLAMAVEYGYPADRVEAQIKEYDQKIASAKTVRKVRTAGNVFMAIVILVAVLIFAYFVLSRIVAVVGTWCERRL
jgi:tetratricopeptide (TPR) repeat protein